MWNDRSVLIYSKVPQTVTNQIKLLLLNYFLPINLLDRLDLYIRAQSEG